MIMVCTQKILMFSIFFVFLFTLQSYMVTPSYSRSIIKSLPGYPGDLPFNLETGYVGIGEMEELQLFYYFVESERNPQEDPLIFYFPGGPGSSGLLGCFFEIGPLSFNFNNGSEDFAMTLNPNSWTKMASVIFLDIPAGVGFSYAKTKEAWISSDSIMVTQANAFMKKFLLKHPNYLKNPLYIAGVSYMGIVSPGITLEVYEGNERGDQPRLNIQGYILGSPLTNKFMDFNSRLEFAHRMALISDDIYKSAVENCHGNYVNVDTTNSLCAKSLQRYEECTSRINFANILEPFCDEKDLMPYCLYVTNALEIWANNEMVQQALNIRQGTIGKFTLINTTMHYAQGKNDTFCYAYDIFSSFPYHRKLANKNCRSLIFSGDHDMTFPYVGIEQWIASLDLRVKIPWEPFYFDGQIGGYEMTYAQNDFSMTFATIKGAGHLIPVDKPKEAMVVLERWFASQTYSSDSYIRGDRSICDAS